MTTTAILFDPLVPLWALAALGALAALAVALAAWRGLSGWWLRAAAALVLLAALAGPSRQDEIRVALSDIVVAVVDESASQRLGTRPAQTEAALANLRAEIAALPDTELRVVRVGDAPGDQGSLVLTALAKALAAEPRARIAGAVLITDGLVHDLDAAPDMPAPLHLLLTGAPDDWDRRLAVRAAPAFAIIGEEVRLTLAIEDQGAVPDAVTGMAELTVRVDGGEALSFSVPVGQELSVPVMLDHGGLNVLQFTLAPMAGEMTARNNVAVVQINGVRDRLRVLLVSGEPYAGERTWRNLLKSDASVDLVHFTILRPPEKQDGVPVNELSLIAFPTRELFVEKIEEFDLIIFDRYRRRGILPSAYIDNVRDYVRHGGAVLVAAGPEFGSADSLFRSSLAEILPAAPTGRVIEQGFLPRVTDLGRRHPVTAGLDAGGVGGEGDAPPWGRWFRLIEMEPTRGQVAMTGAGGRPLLVLDRVEDGRVALLASDHAWLWGRGFEGGGPQLELLRRVAYWAMAEPELEEEALTATAAGREVTITRRTLADGPQRVTITGPDGSETALDLREAAPGRFTATWRAPEMGLYRLADGALSRVVALGPATPREFVETVANGARLAGPVGASGGGVVALGARAVDARGVGVGAVGVRGVGARGVGVGAVGVGAVGAVNVHAVGVRAVDVRAVRAGRVAAGRGWIAITPRGAHLTTDITLRALMPAWLLLLIAAALAVGAWLWEGHRGSARVRPAG